MEKMSNVPAKKRVKTPIIVETISSTGEKKVFVNTEKKQFFLNRVPVPEDHVRAIVLIDYKGMTDDLYAGDVQDIPLRRFKSLANRGIIKEYDGDRPPNKMR